MEIVITGYQQRKGIATLNTNACPECGRAGQFNVYVEEHWAGCCLVHHSPGHWQNYCPDCEITWHWE